MSFGNAASEILKIYLTMAHSCVKFTSVCTESDRTGRASIVQQSLAFFNDRLTLR